MRLIVAEIERLLGRSSEWNGHIEIVAERSRAFGGKTFACLVRLRADVAATDLRWPTLLHQAFHCFSAGRNPDATLNYPGYEEGVVEQLQRLFRQEILGRLNTRIAPEAFVDRDNNSAYTDYIEALEAMRLVFGKEVRSFYLELLDTPLEQRWAVLREQAQQLPVWRKTTFHRDWKRRETVLHGQG